MRRSPFFLLLALASGTLASATPFTDQIEPLLSGLCTDCHGSKDPKGAISFENIDANLQTGTDIETWGKILDRLVLGEMPPADREQPSAKERADLIAWIRNEMIKGGRVPENKLERPGYGNYVPHEQLFGNTPAKPSLSPPRLWRIRPAVYEERMRSLDKNAKFVKPFTLSAGGHGFKDYDNQYKLAGADLNQLMANARVAAEKLTETKVEKGKVHRGARTPQEFFDILHPDSKHATDEQLSTAIGWLFPRVMLRSPREEETARLLEFARTSIDTNGKTLGFRNLISAILLNPESLYRSERGGGKPDAHGRVRLGGREIAYALAYTLTDSRPDAALLEAATGGQLATRDGVLRHARRMLDAEKVAKPRILGFFREYFEYAGALDVFKDAELFRSHSPDALVEDTDRLIMHIYEGDRDVLRELLTTRKSFVQFTIEKGKPARSNAKTHGAHLAYNLPPDWKWYPEQPIRLPGNQRAGILTQPSWLVAKSGNFDNDAIRRGLWIRRKLLGGTIPDLPITVDAQLPEDATKTLRERMHVTREQYCWKCHSRMNPLGESFEMFDHFGRWRTRELEKPVLTNGSVGGSGDAELDGEVKNAIELVHKLAASDRVRQVFVRHAFRYFMGRNETLDDAATLRRADKAYIDAGGSMKQLILSLMTSDSFLYRKDQ